MSSLPGFRLAAEWYPCVDPRFRQAADWCPLADPSPLPADRYPFSIPFPTGCGLVPVCRPRFRQSTDWYPFADPVSDRPRTDTRSRTSIPTGRGSIPALNSVSDSPRTGTRSRTPFPTSRGLIPVRGPRFQQAADQYPLVDQSATGRGLVPICNSFRTGRGSLSVCGPSPDRQLAGIRVFWLQKTEDGLNWFKW